MKRNRLKKYDSTENQSFSVYPTTLNSLRSLSGHFGSIGRAINVAVEILYYREREGLPLVGSGLASMEEKSEDLKVPLSFSVIPRTKKLIVWLADPERYKSRGGVISSCEGLLSDMYTEYYLHRMTDAEREKETERARREQQKDRKQQRKG